MDLPAPLDSYFSAANTDDIDSIVACFAPDAAVEDERQDHVGHDAIRRWASGAREKYRFRSEPFRIAGEASHPVVDAHVSGDFPGSPVDLTYRFEIADGAIKTLSIR